MGRKRGKPRKNQCASNRTDYEKDQKSLEQSDEKPHKYDKPHVMEEPKQNDSKENSLKSNEVDSISETEIMFEKYRPSTERVMGREYFIHSLCQVCKEELNSRVLCPKCQLVSYCSQNHRKQHWPAHADLCEAIVEVCADREVDHILQGSVDCSNEEFRIFRFQNMVECEAKVGRPLDRWEREMFIFPNVCSTCHEYDCRHLTICENCKHSGFCKDHRTQNHEKWCDLLLRYKNIVKDQSKFGIVCPSIPNSNLSTSIPKLQDMKQVFRGILKYIDFFEFIELTEITTYPLTALSALLMINENQTLPQNVTLHVIGAEAEFEIIKPEKWEYYILHLIPGLKTLEIEFIGPELKPTATQKAVKVCSKCNSEGKLMNVKFHKDLYHVFSKNPNFSKPQLICVFNPGLYRTTGFNNQDTWSPTIVSMFAQNCPVLTTSYTHKEILLDVQRVQQTQQIVMSSEPTLNPLSSLKPNLNFVSDEESPVIFKNHYYCIMSKA